MTLSMKVALVTGSTSGIGLGIARTLAAAGADVLLNGFGEPALIEKLLADLRSQYRVRAAYSPADMSKPAEVAQMVSQAGGVQKRIDDRAARENVSVAKAGVELLREKQPSLEFATPGQIGAAALFLCSEGAAQVRGIALPIDGGWTAQ